MSDQPTVAVYEIDSCDTCQRHVLDREHAAGPCQNSSTHTELVVNVAALDALRPFAGCQTTESGAPRPDDQWPPMRERITDWMGYSDFRAACAVIAEADRQRRALGDLSVPDPHAEDERAATVDETATAILAMADPNTLGETLRELVFPGDGLGCYSTFEVRDGARPLHPKQIAAFWLAASEDPENMEDVLALSHGYRMRIGALTVEAYWYWDGDGVLALRAATPGRRPRTVINTDCKKTYRWQGVDDVPAA